MMTTTLVTTTLVTKTPAHLTAAHDLSRPVPSPCISVCQMDPIHGTCIGCLRTLDEIAAWSQLDEAAKGEVWQRLRARAAALNATVPAAAP